MAKKPVGSDRHDEFCGCGNCQKFGTRVGDTLAGYKTAKDKAGGRATKGHVQHAGDDTPQHRR